MEFRDQQEPYYVYIYIDIDYLVYIVYIVYIYIYCKFLLAAEPEPFQRISILQECCNSVHTMHMYVS